MNGSKKEFFDVFSLIFETLNSVFLIYVADLYIFFHFFFFFCNLISVEFEI